MSFLVLKFNELTKIIYLFIILTGLILGLIQLINYLFGGNLGIVQSLTPSITASLFILGLLLRKVTIKHRLLTHIIGKPIIHGLWKGKLISNFEIDGQKLPPIEIYFYIKQTFLITTIKSFTSSQSSESVITALSFNKDSETSDFIYIYRFYRTKNSENKVTFGSGNLRLTNDSQTLEGIYWTNANTCGEIELNLVDRNCANVDSYQMATKLQTNKK
ncbi:hypothetical protein RR32_14540 [Acinetobacter nosocomialis]|uniref:Cap15 family cyclic dinucleotide receptor domain-containing protein n=1 Tax=Acinetobacter calcoaceticus/baumannii complex TaxID=909768 RepID=UPI00057F866C|nr:MULTISPECIES: hypothetical protein [Acinetobacter calcoaceticus/baumannii complex]AJB49273.1 hypothetical protein RR32_14540 [Acinetobacter nosocomialis]MBR7740255.1 hypothetical protein [Acinetobacter nosocomialis]PRV98008.1 hypothetical protein CSB87_2518 [Acinetobacter sp. AR_0276]